MSSILTRPRHPERFVVIFNPNAGHAKRGSDRLVHELLREHDLEYEMRPTGSADEARAVARGAAEAGVGVIAAGGDGTIHCVANGVLSAEGAPVPIGLLPLGTGNDFARALEGRPTLQGAARALASGRPRAIDVGQIGADEYFVNALGIGFDGEVVRRRSAKDRPARGYLSSVLITALSYAPQSYRLQLDPAGDEHDDDGERERRALMIGIMNGPSEGGGFRLAPGARLDDGLLEVCWIDPVNLWQFVRYVRSVRRGTHTDLPVVSIRQSKRLRVESLGKLQYHVDGEYRELPPGASLDVRVHPGRLHLLA